MRLIDIAAIDLNLLVAFEAIFTERSVTAAAQRLHLGQPAMSAALGRLRVLFQDELFIRSGRDMKPTVKALEVAPGISAALQQIRVTLQASQQFDPATAQQSFVIGCTDYASIVIAPRLLNVCRQSAPGIDLRLISYEKDQISTLLEQPNLAVILGGNFQNLPPQIMQRSLMQEQFVGICRQGHPCINAGVISLADFAALPHALVTLRRDDVGVIDQVLATHNLQRRVILTTPYWLSLPAMLADSDIIAAIPSRLAQQVIESRSLQQFELPIELASWSVGMIWSKVSDQASDYRWLRQTIQQVCAAL